MPKKIEKDGDRRDHIIMVRFLNKHRVVIDQVAKASGKTASAFIRRLVYDHVRMVLEMEGDPTYLEMVDPD